LKTIKIMLIAGVLIGLPQNVAAKSRGFLDFVFDAIDYVHDRECDRLIAEVDHVLQDIVYEMRYFSPRFSYIHDYQLGDIRFLFGSIRRDWIPFAIDYDAYRGLYASDLYHMRDVLCDLLHTMQRAPVDPYFNYDYELTKIHNLLVRVIDKMNPPSVVYWTSSCWYHIADLFEEIAYTIRTM